MKKKETPAQLCDRLDQIDDQIRYQNDYRDSLHKSLISQVKVIDFYREEDAEADMLAVFNKTRVVLEESISMVDISINNLESVKELIEEDYNLASCGAW